MILKRNSLKKMTNLEANENSFPFGIYFAVKDTILNILAVFCYSINPKKLRRE